MREYSLKWKILYLKFSYQNVEYPRKAPQHWLTDTPFRYDPRSIMQLDSFAYSNSSGPVFALKDNVLVRNGQWLTTTDVARVKWLYCRNDQSEYTECDRFIQTSEV